MTQQAFLRPIEIAASNKDISVNYSGGGAQTVSLTAGVYGSILTLIYDLNATLQALGAPASAHLSCYIDADYKVVFKSDDLNFTVTFTDTDLARLLGFTANQSGAAIYTATYTPKYCWFPAHHSYDVDRFWNKEQFSGSTSLNGILSGIKLSDGVRRRSFKFDALAAATVAQDACTLTYWSTYYPQEERCLETFVEGARTATPDDDAAEGLSVKGCYFLPDIDDYCGATPSTAIPSSMNGGGYRFELATSPPTYLFCNMGVAKWDNPNPSIETMRAFYNCGFTLTSCIDSCPTWNQP